MRRIFFSMVAAVGFSGDALADCSESDRSDCPSQQPLLTVDASFAELPYGQVWEVRYGGGDEIEIEINNPPPRVGAVTGRIRLAADDAETLRRVLGEQRFFDLAGDIANGYPLHRPKLMLHITLGQKKHRVVLYDPINSKSHPQSSRFLAVWNAFFSLLPVQPSWE